MKISITSVVKAAFLYYDVLFGPIQVAYSSDLGKILRYEYDANILKL